MATPQFVPAPFTVPAVFVNELSQAATLLDAGASALSTAQRVMAAIGDTGIDSDHKSLVYFIFGKALKTANGVQVLCRCGYGSDGLSLCAAIFENLIDLLYIGIAPKTRARRYFQFENVDKYFQARKILAYKRLPKGRRKIYRRYESNLLPIVRPLLKHFPDSKGGWAQKSLYQRAKAVKAGLVYQELYWIFCAHKHTFPMSAIGTTISNTTGESRVITEPHIKGVCDAVEQSGTLLLQVCMVVDQVFGCVLRSEIDKSLFALQDSATTLRQHNLRLFT
jgi:hypothetical protein